ncbi:nucleoside monophosphate kinase [Aquimarina spongiae]|nr:nucleoside monophosphate kinase [Aquimarina spongiae]
MKIISIFKAPSKSFHDQLLNIVDDKYEVVYLTELIRNILLEDSDLSASIRKSISESKPIPDEDFSNLIIKKITQKVEQNYIVVGFPRTLHQLQMFAKHLKKAMINYDLIGITMEIEVEDAIKKWYGKNGKLIELKDFNSLAKYLNKN